jgi:hypothetical protein
VTIESVFEWAGKIATVFGVAAFTLIAVPIWIAGYVAYRVGLVE